MQITAFALAERYIGVKEVDGQLSNPAILFMLQLDNKWPADDDVPWCSAFLNFICWSLGLPRSKSLLARSWLTVGREISLFEARPGFDIAILKRGQEPQPGPESVTAPGHVGLFAGLDTDGSMIELLAGNQGNAVSVDRFQVERILGLRRLHDE